MFIAMILSIQNKQLFFILIILNPALYQIEYIDLKVKRNFR